MKFEEKQLRNVILYFRCDDNLDPIPGTLLKILAVFLGIRKIYLAVKNSLLFLAESPREMNNSKDWNSLLFLAESPRETNNSKDSNLLLFLAESPRETEQQQGLELSFVSCRIPAGDEQQQGLELIFVFIAESPRETNNSKDSPASQADSGVFSIASSASPSKTDTVLNSDVRSPESPSRSLGDQQHPHQSKQEHNQCEYRRVSMCGSGFPTKFKDNFFTYLGCDFLNCGENCQVRSHENKQ